MGYGLTLTETLLPQLGGTAPAVGPTDWEVGRLVLAPAYRADVDHLGHYLRLALGYVRQHDDVHGLFAACTHVLSRLYRRYGFQAFARDVPLLGTPKTYTLIRGCAEEITRKAAAASVPRTVQ